MTALESMFLLVARVRNRMYTTLLSRCLGQIGRGSVIVPPCRFTNLHLVRLGDRVLVERDCWLLAIEADGPVDVPRIHLKTGVAVGMGSTISAAKSVVLDEDVLLARNVYISDNAHRFDDIGAPIARQGLGKCRPVVIGMRTWIGQNACVLPGVRVGRHCVIGANAVVNQDVPDYTVVAGVPARPIKRYDVEKQTWVRC